MKSIASVKNFIHFGETAYQYLNNYLNDNNPSKVFILVDSHTKELCLPSFLQKLATTIEIEIIEIEPGESEKNITTCNGVWEALTELDADRKSLCINLGGGVVTDLGGFVASTYKRGIAYINIPTTLLGMVDAAVGGKTGVDLGKLKNQIGVISNAEMVLIDTSFLTTLSANEMRSGLAEMLKHGLIADSSYWSKMSDLSQLTLDDLDELIYESILIKNNIVTQDLNEDGIRKALNFGHTLGHAIESYFLESNEKETLLHGEAVAVGMILAAYLSNQLQGLDSKQTQEIKQTILKTFPKVEFAKEDLAPIIDLMKYDKKNSHGIINFVLLSSIGKPIIDCQVSNNLIEKSFQFYSE